MIEFKFNYQERSYNATYQLVYEIKDIFCNIVLKDRGLPYPFSDSFVMVYDKKSNELTWGDQEIQRANLLLVISIGIKEAMNEAERDTVKTTIE
ncbi:MAG TPA: hypothetical protein VK543_10790 [Puia sp.]|nr:hypothetical protein [Puia sp.]